MAPSTCGSTVLRCLWGEVSKVTAEDVFNKIEDLRSVDKEKASDLWEMYTKLSMAGGRLKRGTGLPRKERFCLYRCERISRHPYCRD